MFGCVRSQIQMQNLFKFSEIFILRFQNIILCTSITSKKSWNWKSHDIYCTVCSTFKYFEKVTTTVCISNILLLLAVPLDPVLVLVDSWGWLPPVVHRADRLSPELQLCQLTQPTVHRRYFHWKDKISSVNNMQGWAPRSFTFWMRRSFAFFCVLLMNPTFFCVLFSSFWRLIKPKRTMRSFAFFLKNVKERKERNCGGLV